MTRRSSIHRARGPLALGVAAGVTVALTALAAAWGEGADSFKGQAKTPAIAQRSQPPAPTAHAAGPTPP